MIATSKKKASTQFPKTKIAHAVKTILPNGNFKVQVADSEIGKMKTVRVITPAWKSLRPAERIGKVLGAVSGKLTAKEQDGILRFSVLLHAAFCLNMPLPLEWGSEVAGSNPVGPIYENKWKTGFCPAEFFG